MKTNETLQKDVQDAIKWEPLLNAAEIGVTVKDGIVTLTGRVDNFAKKLEAERAAKNVLGVKALVEQIEVHLHSGWEKKDGDAIANEILNAFKWSWNVPNDVIKVKVENGWVTLEGETEWNYQREGAENVASRQDGVRGLTNRIIIKSPGHDRIEKSDIEEALARNWAIDSENIQVKVHNNNVTLTGIVESVYEKEQAASIAWNAPGVWSVDNELVIEHDYSLAE
jgi:osmotically-inducible protein OsmY